jgi:diadenosine tetraphosphate (Ap4A) HIT family hydrolase
VTSAPCHFCDHAARKADAFLYEEDDLCVFQNREDFDGDLLRGSGVIFPKRHRPSVFDLTPEEVTSTFALLGRARCLLDERYKPDGYTIGWNCFAAAGGAPHAHLHVLLRFWDEPKAGHGLRWPLRQPDNRRPDPSAPGSGDTRFLGDSSLPPELRHGPS